MLQTCSSSPDVYEWWKFCAAGIRENSDVVLVEDIVDQGLESGMIDIAVDQDSELLLAARPAEMSCWEPGRRNRNHRAASSSVAGRMPRISICMP